MTEHEEFELVAQAAGYEYQWHESECCDESIVKPPGSNSWFVWNPKTDDGDSRRLQVDLGIDVMLSDIDAAAGTLEVRLPQIKSFKDHPDKYAAVKAAVWGVAVEVAKRRMARK